MDRPWEAFDRARRVLRGRDDLVGWKSADLPSVGVHLEHLECSWQPHIQGRGAQKRTQRAG